MVYTTILIHPMVMKKKHAGAKIPPLPPNLPLFQWNPDHQESFVKLKEALVTAPVLAYPNYNKPFILETCISKRVRHCIIPGK